MLSSARPLAVRLNAERLAAEHLVSGRMWRRSTSAFIGAVADLCSRTSGRSRWREEMFGHPLTGTDGTRMFEPSF
jgi:hypothetical protein